MCKCVPNADGTDYMDVSPIMAEIQIDRTAVEARAAAEIQAVFPDVLTEIRRAVAKHGYTQTPLWAGMTSAAKLAVLVEEVGEVASAITYDRADDENLKAELIQVATMAIAWRASLG